jgi:serine protein kinase
MANNFDIQNFITQNYNPKDFSHLHWQGNIQEYIDLAMKDPKICRNAFQRIYDMIMSYGTSNYTEYKKDVVRYHFFDDPIENGKDAIFGIDVHLMKLVNFFQ